MISVLALFWNVYDRTAAVLIMTNTSNTCSSCRASRTGGSSLSSMHHTPQRCRVSTESVAKNTILARTSQRREERNEASGPGGRRTGNGRFSVPSSQVGIPCTLIMISSRRRTSSPPSFELGSVYRMTISRSSSRNARSLRSSEDGTAPTQRRSRLRRSSCSFSVLYATSGVAGRSTTSRSRQRYPETSTGCSFTRSSTSAALLYTIDM
mmetsp:Transcript_686/g.1644  ORF Transcript_686/g.1644 Transcript_686/m.1644 type:complete len:209 (+) Transcript_686:30-656(+)